MHLARAWISAEKLQLKFVRNSGHATNASAPKCGAGDAEGANEMTYSMGFLRQFCRAFQQNAATTRIFFPDKQVRRQANKQRMTLMMLCQLTYTQATDLKPHLPHICPALPIG